MKSRMFRIFGNLKDGIERQIDTKISFYDLDKEAQEAVVKKFVNEGYFLTLVSAEKAAKKIKYILRDPVNKMYKYSFTYFLKYDPEEVERINALSDKQKTILAVREYDLSNEAMDIICEEVRKYDIDLDNILKLYSLKKKASWRDLSPSRIEEIIKIYNNSNIDIKTGKIIL